MKRDELLQWIKSRISPRYYDTLTVWTLKRKNKFLFWERIFDVEPTPFGDGLIVRSGRLFDYIIVY